MEHLHITRELRQLPIIKIGGYQLKRNNMTPEQNQIIHQLSKDQLIKIIGNYCFTWNIITENERMVNACRGYCVDNGFEIPKLQTIEVEKHIPFQYESPETKKFFEEQLTLLNKIENDLTIRIGEDGVRKLRIDKFKEELTVSSN